MHIPNNDLTQNPFDIPLTGAVAAGTFKYGVPTGGAISSAGQFDEWAFYGRAGRAIGIVVNPGSTGSPAPTSPRLQWAMVQLLDASNNALASGANTGAGDIVTLSGVVLIADGT